MTEMAEAFDIRRVNPNPARFDLKKLEAINAAHMRLLPVDAMSERIAPFLKAAGLLPVEPSADQQALLAAATPLVNERMTTLSEAVDMLGFLFTDEADFERDPGDVAKLLDEDGRAVVTTAQDALQQLDTWDTAAIEAALRTSLVEGLGLKPRNAFGPVRVAITGRRISPPLFESMELLGRERSMSRLTSARSSSP
jgi:glutamyl-tRNA synthetase